jgi:hypothetical protein
MTRCCGDSAGVRQSLPVLFARLPYRRSLHGRCDKLSASDKCAWLVAGSVRIGIAGRPCLMRCRRVRSSSKGADR